MENDCPSLTVITLAPYGLEDIRDTLWSLSLQTIASEIEIIVVLRSSESNPVMETIERFHSFQTLVEQPMKISGEAKAQAVRAARAEIVAFAEDHCFPEAEWAENLLQAHRGPWGAVTPWMGPANPESPLSRASFNNAFAPWNSEHRGECSNLPTHNTSYKRDLLLDYGGELGKMLDMEAATLAPDLIHRGFPIFHEPDARVHHINVEKPLAFCLEQFLGGRHFGALRSEDWSVLRRMVYCLGSWLIPLVRLLRMAPTRSSKSQGLSTIILGMSLSALGESIGYALGMGKTDERRFEMEYRRYRFTKRRYTAKEILANASSLAHA